MRRILTILAVGIVLTACTTTKMVTVERVRTDTTYITKHQRDSIWLHDSINVTKKNNTTLIEKWHTKYVGRLRVDTFIRIKTDSIPVPYEVVMEVPRQLTWWQSTQMYAGDLLMLFIVAACAIFVIRKKLPL